MTAGDFRADGSATRLGRRAVLAGGAAASLLFPGPQARAAIVNMCVVGTDGWLFPAFDEVRRSDLALVRRTAGQVNDAVAVLKAAKLDVVLSFTPAKSRVYREFLPADFKWSPDAEKRYSVALEELRRPGTLVPDQATMFATTWQRCCRRPSRRNIRSRATWCASLPRQVAAACWMTSRPMSW